MSRFLVTGGAGFLGAHLTHALIAQGHEVRVLDNLSSGRVERLPKSADLTIGDVADSAQVTRLCEAVDGCFHLAAIPSVTRTIEEWPESHKINAGGAIVVFDAARRAGGIPVVYASSAAIYGDCDKPLIDEATPALPISPYGVDKLSNELHARVAAHQFGLPSVGLRFFNIYGPHQLSSSPYAGVISIFLSRAASGEPLLIHGDGEQERDFVYVDDAVAALIAAMANARATGLVTNICTGLSVRILDLAKIVYALIDRPANIVFSASRPGDIRRSVGDGALAKAALGFSAQVTIRDGLERLVTSQSRR